MSKKKPDNSNVIAANRRARHDYFIEDRVEAGLSLLGWEVKSLREGRAQLSESYVTIMNGEAFLVGAHFSPLLSTSTHVQADPTRSRKLLMHRGELDRLVGAVERKGYLEDRRPNANIDPYTVARLMVETVCGAMK